MPFGLLVILGIAAYLWYEQKKNASFEPVADTNRVWRAWDLLTAWSQSQSGSAPTSELAGGASDPAFKSLAGAFQQWANAHGWNYQPSGGQAQELRTDGVLDGATLAVLEAHVQLASGPALSTFTTGGHYYVSFVRGTDGELADTWKLSSEVDAPPAPQGLQGPAAWLAELSQSGGGGRAIAIGQWIGAQYGSDDRVVVFGSAKPPPAAWAETTSAMAPVATLGAVPVAPQPVPAGCYRVSYVSMGEVADSLAVAAAKASASVSFELESNPPSPVSGGPWPADDAGTSMGAGRSPAGMPTPPVPRVRMQWCTSRATPLPIPVGAVGVRVWQQSSSPDTVSYRGVSISLKDGGDSVASTLSRWSALYTIPQPPSGAPPGPPTRALESGATRSAALHAAEGAIDATLAQPEYSYAGPPMS